MKTLDVLLARYRQHLQLLNYSPRTLETQATYLNRFCEFLAEMNLQDVQLITSAVLQDFQRWLFYRPTVKNTARTVPSQNRVLSTIKSFFNFLHEEGYLGHNPAASLRYAKEPDSLPRNVLTPQEARKIIESPDTNTLIGYRDRTILEVLYSTGIRKAELMNLKLEDVNLEEELLTIRHGKGAKDRVVPLSRIACSFLESYIKGIRPELLRGATTDKLFVSVRLGHPLGHHSLAAVINRYTRAAGVQKKVTAHLWRHTCATHLLKNKANLRHVQEILGHRSLATTERYLRLTITDLKEAHRKYHPRERQKNL
jgi:integrase/recombinase XerD